MTISRRGLFQAAAGATFAIGAQASAGAPIAPGPFGPTWDSLIAGYQAPDWFRDAKFGIWAHWSAQCVPELGDWYARTMYILGDPKYDHHLKHYGRLCCKAWSRTREERYECSL